MRFNIYPLVKKQMPNATEEEIRKEIEKRREKASLVSPYLNDGCFDDGKED